MPAASRIVPPLSASAFTTIETPFASFEPANTVYVKVSAVVPLPPL